MIRLTDSTGVAAQTADLVVPARKEVTFSTTSAVAVASTDVSNYSFASVHIVTQGGSSTVTFQGSNDNTNWVSVAMSTIGATGTTQPVTSTTSASVVHVAPLPFRYFRLNVTGIASGTTAGVVEFSAAPGVVSLTANSVPTTPTAHFLTSAATTNATAVKTSGATMYTLTAFNAGAGAAFVKIYNKASAPTVGTDVPVMVLALAATASDSLVLGPIGIRLATGLGLAITGVAADTDTTAVAAAQVHTVISYI